MKQAQAFLIRSVILMLGGMFLVPSGLAQGNAPSRPVRIDRIKGSKVKTPEYEVKRISVASRTTREWFQILTEYRSAPDWIDQLDVTYYALVKTRRDSGAEAPYILFRGQVSYVDVEKGRHDSVMYMHPSTISRYGDVDRVAVLMYVKGQLVSMESEPSGGERWWERFSPQDGYLRKRTETPFAMISDDNYEAIKAGGPSR